MNVRARIGLGLAMLSLLATGCTSSLHKQAEAFAGATAPVVDEAEQAYKDANVLHDLRLNYEAAEKFDAKTTPPYNPRTIEPLLRQKDLDVRLAVLKGLQLYVKRVVAMTGGAESKALDSASSDFAASLTGVANTLLPQGTSSSTETEKVTDEDGTTSTQVITTSVAADKISADEKNALAVAVNALGQYLVTRKVKEELPKWIEENDGAIKELCEFLKKDIVTLRSQEKMDINFIINRQSTFLLKHTDMDAGERRGLIMQLPDIVRKKQAADENLDGLTAGLEKLEMTHHALTADAAKNSPDSWKTKFGELESAGQNLGKYYSTLSSK